MIKCLSTVCRNKWNHATVLRLCGRHEGTIIRIKQALNSTGSMVGIAWGVMVCSQGWPRRWRRFLPLRHPRLSDCTPSHPKHGILIFSASNSLAWNMFQSAGLWCFVVGQVVRSILKDYSVFVFTVRPAKNSCCSFLVQHSRRAGWSDSKFPCGHSSPCAQCITLML